MNTAEKTGGGDLIDHRVYTIKPRNMGKFLEVFNDLAMPVLLETLGAPIGTYVSHVGQLNQFVHLWAYRDMADLEQRCKARDQHPGFAAYLVASEPLIVGQESRLLRRVEMKALREYKSH